MDWLTDQQTHNYGAPTLMLVFNSAGMTEVPVGTCHLFHRSADGESCFAAVRLCIVDS